MVVVQQLSLAAQPYSPAKGFFMVENSVNELSGIASELLYSV